MIEARRELVDQGESLEAARRELMLTQLDLWYGYFAVGGELPYDTVRSYLKGATGATRREHNKLALVLNEAFQDLRAEQSVPYLS